MGKFLASLLSLVVKGDIKKIEQAYKFAKQEFGEITPLLKKQIERIFSQVKKPKVGKEVKKEAEVIPFKKEGIETLKNDKSIMDQIDKSKNKIEGASNRITEIQKEIDGMYKPKPDVEDSSDLMKRLEDKVSKMKITENISTGLTRTIAREILGKKGIELPKGSEPLEVFKQKFGQDVLIDVNNLAEELIEMDRRGIKPKPLTQLIEEGGFFDVKMPKEPPQGFTPDELADVQKEVDQEDILLKFDPTDRDPNAEGGRIGYADGNNNPKKLIKKIPKVGKIVSGLESLKSAIGKIMTKFGDDAITTADRAPQPKKTIQEEITGGITNLEEFLKRKKGFASGGRVGMFRGGVPKGLQAAMRAIMSKYGDDAITTADRAPQPEKTIQEQIMDFNARNRPDAITIDSREILDVPAVPGGFKLSKEKLMARFPELEESFVDEMMQMDPDLQGRIIKMLENRRLDPEAYDNLLDTKGDTLEFQGEFDKITRRKNNADGGSVDGDVSLTAIKIPDISESGVESLFKRR